MDTHFAGGAAADLVLKAGGGRVRLARFTGQAEMGTGTEGRSIFTVRDLEEDAGLAVSMLQRLLGVTIGKPLPDLADAQGRTCCCSLCGRAGPPGRATCLYCGGSMRID